MLRDLKVVKLLALVLLGALAAAAHGPNAAAQPKDPVVEKRRVTAQTVLKLKLAPGGGSAIRLAPVH